VRPLQIDLLLPAKFVTGGFPNELTQAQNQGGHLGRNLGGRRPTEGGAEGGGSGLGKWGGIYFCCAMSDMGRKGRVLGHKVSPIQREVVNCGWGGGGGWKESGLGGVPVHIAGISPHFGMDLN